MNNEQPPHQQKLHGIPYADIDDALVDLISALGGFKRVGPRLWPALPAEDATQRLRHCLNKSRREKLGQHELLAVLRMGRDAAFHNAKAFIDEHCGYTRSQPVEPEDEYAELQRLYIDTVAQQKLIAERMERLASRGPVLVHSKTGGT